MMISNTTIHCLVGFAGVKEKVSFSCFGVGARNDDEKCKPRHSSSFLFWSFGLCSTIMVVFLCFLLLVILVFLFILVCGKWKPRRKGLRPLISKL
jgi:hypothetical protein